jgi:hypothetical protein
LPTTTVNVSPGVTGILFFQLNPPPPPAPDVEFPLLIDAAPPPPPPITTALMLVTPVGIVKDEDPATTFAL